MVSNPYPWPGPKDQQNKLSPEAIKIIKILYKAHTRKARGCTSEDNYGEDKLERKTSRSIIHGLVN